MALLRRKMTRLLPLLLTSCAALPSPPHLDTTLSMPRPAESRSEGAPSGSEMSASAESRQDSAATQKDDLAASPTGWKPSRQRNRVMHSNAAAPQTADPSVAVTGGETPVPNSARLAEVYEAVGLPSGPNSAVDTDSNDNDSEYRSATGRVWTLEALQELALSQHPALAAADAVVDKTLGFRYQARRPPNPMLGYIGDEMGDDGTAGKQGGFLMQQFITAGKLRLQQAIAHQDVITAQWDLEARRYQILTDIHVQFYEVLGLQRRLELLDALEQVVRQGVESAEALLKAELGTKPDVLQAEIELQQVRVLRVQAEAERDAAWRRLAALVGQPDLPMGRLSGELAESVQPRTFDDVWMQLEQTSPLLQRALARVERARVAIRRQEVQPIPNVLTRMEFTHDNVGNDELVTLWMGLPIPIFDRNRGNISAAYAEYRRALADLERTRLWMRDQLAAAMRDYESARRQVELYRTVILEKAKDNLDLTLEGYKQGEFDFLRALTARRTFIETRLAYLAAQVTLNQAEARLSGLLLTGGLNSVTDVTQQ